MAHKPVLCNEVVQALNINPAGCYVDATFGRGGHSYAILDALGPTGCLIALDRDPEAIQSVPPILQQDKRFHLHQGPFSDLNAFVRHYRSQVQGILFDIGVSSPQLDNPKRGFSFQKEGPLDMRMDPTQGISAATWLATAEMKDIQQVIRSLGEEPFAKQIAARINEVRQIAPIQDTIQLANLIRDTIPARHHVRGKHPATQTFQAIRMHINQELEELTQGLQQAVSLLAPQGRLCVISFHSLEDRLVKRFFMAQTGASIPKDIPLRESEVPRILKIISRIRPTPSEMTHNPRARSATLRVAEKVQHAHH